MKGANRLIAIAFAAVWVFPGYKLLDLPQERALNGAKALGGLLQFTEKDAILAQKVLPSHASEFAKAREEATTHAANPELLEPEMRLSWLIEAGFVIVGVFGIASLWWKPRHWRYGAIAGVLAFVAVSGLYYVAKLLWMSRGSAEATWNVLRLSTILPSTIAMHLVAPFILVAVIIYALLSRDGAVTR